MAFAIVRLEPTALLVYPWGSKRVDRVISVVAGTSDSDELPGVSLIEAPP